MILLAPNSSVEIGISLLYLNNGIKEVSFRVRVRDTRGSWPITYIHNIEMKYRLCPNLGKITKRQMSLM